MIARIVREDEHPMSRVAPHVERARSIPGSRTEVGTGLPDGDGRDGTVSRPGSGGRPVVA
jgi:hypothetical protein